MHPVTSVPALAKIIAGALYAAGQSESALTHINESPDALLAAIKLHLVKWKDEE